MGKKSQTNAGGPLPGAGNSTGVEGNTAVSVSGKTAPATHNAPKDRKTPEGVKPTARPEAPKKAQEKVVSITLGANGGKKKAQPQPLKFERPAKATVVNLMINTAKAEFSGGEDRSGGTAAHGAQKTTGSDAAANTQKKNKTRLTRYFAGEDNVTPRRRHTPEELAACREKNKRKKRVQGRTWRAISRTLGVVGLVLGMGLVLAFGAITMICVGPFPTAKELFVVSVNETSAVKFLSHIYFTPEEVSDILAKNAIVVPDEVTDTTQPFAGGEADKDTIEIIDVYGSTYKGKMMIVHDPSRIQLATLPAFSHEVRGRQVEQFVQEAGAIAGINAGGFADEGGTGKGGMPLGLVIHEGAIVSGTADTECNIIGFDGDDHLVVGTMSGREALDMGVRDAVHFEPTLIVNGKPAEVSGTGGGLNPRTVIGQRADGAVLLLVIDGRQPHSVGATLQDCMQEMVNFGAVNAANLDGGSSSMMIYDGEVINVCASLNGSRSQPAAWLVI